MGSLEHLQGCSTSPLIYIWINGGPRVCPVVGEKAIFLLAQLIFIYAMRRLRTS